MTVARDLERRDDRVSVVERVRIVFPFRWVVLPWIAVRLVTVPVLMMSTPGDRFTPGNLLAMDGQWFRFIAVDGYDLPYVPTGWSEYPFFPLFPGIAGVLMNVGFPDTVALTAVSWSASLVAFAGMYVLATDHLPATSRRWAVWVVAFAPGALSLVLGYSDSLFLAGTVWALVAADRHRWVIAGLLAAVATASRPNGVLVVGVLVVAVVVARAGWRAALAVSVPSLAFLAGWVWYLDAHAGDGLAFWGGKEAWDERSILSFVRQPFGDPLAMFHVVVFAVFALAYLMRIRTQPVPWAVLTALVVVPPMVLGVVGLARYAVIAFPIAFAVADVVASRGRVAMIAYLAVSATALSIFAHFVVARAWVP